MQLGRHLHLAGLVVGGAASAMWVFVLTASAVSEGAAAFGFEEAVLAVLIVVATTGVAFALADDILGGFVCVLGGVALAGFATVSAGRNEGMSIAVSAGPFLLAGVLFIGAHIATQRARSREPGSSH